MSGFWHWFIIAITVVSIIGLLWLLFANASAKMATEDTGHVWDDDLREYNNPLPRWWLNLFILTIVFAIGYLVVYPGLGRFAGTFGWTSDEQLDTRLAEVTARRQALFAQFRGQDPDTLKRNAAALSLGRDLFLNNCAGCHGADGRGAIGFPDLTDHDWLYGGSAEQVVASITHGRNGMMPPFNGAIDGATVDALVATITQWGGPGPDAATRQKGMAQFNITCAACHGPEGKGNPMLGAPNLTDSTWLYGGTRERVRESILFGRKGAMPAHDRIIDADEINVVAAYVLSLSAPGGDQAGAP